MNKTIICTVERWNRLQENLLVLAQGNLSKKFRIGQLNDDLESIEVLINMILDEWKHRVLQMTFNKPLDSQKFINNFQILFDKNFNLIDLDEQFPLFMGIESKSILEKKLTDLINKEDERILISYLKNLESDTPFFPETPSIVIIEKSFLYSIKKLGKGEFYILNLLQIQLNSKHFIKRQPGEITSTIKLEQKKRYQDIIQEVKQYIDHFPLNELIRLNQICKNFGINSFQLKKGFRELYQCSPYDYFLTKRLKYAHLLIITSIISLKEISHMVGYSQYPNFSSQFLKAFEIRPKQLRKQSVIANQLKFEEDQ